MRLDAYLAENNIYDSRTRAARAIKEGCVRVNGVVVTKSSYDVCAEKDDISCSEDPVPYVGRGALRLEHAVKNFQIDVKGKKAVDIGASTGGFTQVLLKHEAEYVAAVDVGHGQLAELIRNDERVESFEGTDIRDFIQGEGTYDIAVTDVSFISLKLIVPHIHRLLTVGGVAVVLIKPQFEVGRKFLNKKGVVKDIKTAVCAADEVVEFIKSVGFEILGKCESPVKGGDGNTEFICLCRRTN